MSAPQIRQTSAEFESSPPKGPHFWVKSAIRQTASGELRFGGRRLPNWSERG